MSFIKDFKAFALKGNVIDLAVAVIIGAAFSAVVSSMVEDIITPLLLTPALEAVGAENIAELQWGNVKYGSFLAAVIKFLVFALVIFTMIQALAKLKRKEEEAPSVPPAPSSTDVLLAEIRDELKARKF
ncbi:MAG: large conductance mechanosensitive channel protein MscL [Ginsengibacter sp.]